MKIDRHMNLEDLAERMGDCATLAEADAMRLLLIESPYEDTKHVPANEWSRLLACAVHGADVGPNVAFAWWTYCDRKDGRR